MSTTTSQLIDAAGRAAAPVVRGVPDDRLGAPTPCREYTVRDLLNHLFHVVVGFQALAARKEFDFASPTPDYLHGDWRGRFAEETAHLAQAWAPPGADEGTVGTFGLPATTVGGMAVLDLTVHAWDLARATGEPFTPEPRVLPFLGELLEGLAPMGRGMKVFGDPVPVPEGATAFEALLCATGRDPRWTAEGRTGGA
jgi:uncharacterized protein (TIGR03086 family)